MDAAAVRVRLANTYWIGGGSGAGKSVVARRLAVQHDLRVYATDEVMPEHGGRIRSQDAPFLSRFKRMDMDERGLRRPCWRPSTGSGAKDSA